MNIQSEIDFFSELCPVDKARFVSRLIIEVHEEAKLGSSRGQDSQRLKFSVEISQRLARFTFQLLSEDITRPPDAVMIRMLLAPRGDKISEDILHNAYRRVLAGFEAFDTTVLLNVS